MKTITTLFMALLLGLNLHAQENENPSSFIVGGSMNFFTQKNAFPLATLGINSGLGTTFSNGSSDSRNTVFAILPYVGTSLTEHWILGLSLDYRIGRFKSNQGSLFVNGQIVSGEVERKSGQFGIGVFGRYTFNPADRLSFYVQPNVAFNLLTENDFFRGDQIQEQDINYLEIGVGGGALYRINERLNVLLRVGGLNYINGKWEIKDNNFEQKFSSFNTNFSFQSISFGIELNF